MSIDLGEKILGPQNEAFVNYLNGYANFLLDRKRHAEAEQFYFRALDICMKNPHPYNTTTVDPLYGIALNFVETGHLNEAAELYPLLIDMFR